MKNVGDLAAEMADELRESHNKEVESGERKLRDTPKVMEREGRGVMGKIRFQWRDEDTAALEQIKAGSDGAFVELFDAAMQIIDDLYYKARVPELNEHQQVRRDAQGRPVWQTDASGKPKEEWDRLTGTELDAALMEIQRVRLYVAPRLNELLLHAMYAKHVHDDVHSDAYQSVIDGTIGDRTAKANRVARDDKYAAYFRYYLWSQGEVFMKELDSLKRLIERVREWGIRSQRG